MKSDIISIPISDNFLLRVETNATLVNKSRLFVCVLTLRDSHHAK